ncbi:MAG: hypothetical protein P1P87_01220 [Trueperaceae bacterium]|nr:hypothetical protein [Trueperaceae bacterium]
MKRSVLLVLFLALVAVPVSASDHDLDHDPSLEFAQVTWVDVTARADGTYAFAVTVRHDDAGWDHYADAWEVVDPRTDAVLATRELLHPHETEQPFTRSLDGVVVPEGVTVVLVRARCNVHGFGGRTVTIDLSEPEGEGYTVGR